MSMFRPGGGLHAAALDLATFDATWVLIAGAAGVTATRHCGGGTGKADRVAVCPRRLPVPLGRHRDVEIKPWRLLLDADRAAKDPTYLEAALRAVPERCSGACTPPPFALEGNVCTGALFGVRVASRGVDFSKSKNVRWLTPLRPVQVLHRKGEHFVRAATSKKPSRPARFGARPSRCR